jgi:hypothetical protein
VGEAVDRSRLTQVGRALERLGIEHIAAYSPEARGRSERMFGTLQDRLPKKLTLAGICDVEAAKRFIRDVYLPAHNARFARPPRIAESAFVAADPALLAEIHRAGAHRGTRQHPHLCRPTIAVASHAASPAVRQGQEARVKMREYPDGTLAVFHGPRRIARYSAQGTELIPPP